MDMEHLSNKMNRKRSLPPRSTMTSANKTIINARRSKRRNSDILFLVVTTLLCRATLVHSQFDNFDPTVQDCPEDAAVTGYTTIANLNADIDQEITRIQGGGTPQTLYNIVLCPGTTFDTTAAPLLPRLDAATFTCAGTGNVNDECIFSGGEVNVRIEDPGIQGYTINAINFLGITFTDFTGYSIELLGSAPTEAIFMNCLWQDFAAAGIATIANDSGQPMDLQLDMCTITSSTEDPNDAVLDVAFDNNGGSVLLQSVMVDTIQVDNAFVRTLANGATMVFGSAFRSNSLARISEVSSGMAEFSGITVADNTDVVRMFEADGEGSTTLIENAVIEGNIGLMAYQIFRITDGGGGSLLNSTIRQNNPVEYGVLVLAETEGTEPTGLIEDSLFEANTQEDWALVMSEGVGAFVELRRTQFVGNSGGIMNIGAFFGGDIEFTQNCFIRNEHFLVALILEFSEFVASDNYVEDELSEICSGTDPTEGDGRLSVEQPGSMCFAGGDSCEVDCLPNINDATTCLAQVGTTGPTTVVPAPSVAPVPSIAPTKAPTQAPVARTMAPSKSPTVLPTVATPTNSPTPVPPSPAPAPVTAMPVPTTTAMPVPMPVPTPTMQPPFPAPTRRPTRPSKPTVRPPTYRPPRHDCKYYGIGSPDCSDYKSHHKKPKSQKSNKSSPSPPTPPTKKEPKQTSRKSNKASKDAKSNKSNKSGPSSSNDYYGIGGSGSPYLSSPYSDKSSHSIGYSYAQPRTVGRAGNGKEPTDSRISQKEHYHGIGHIDTEKDGEEE